MSGFATSEGEHILPDGFKVYTKTWNPAKKPPIAILAWLHGFDDHCNCFQELFPYLANNGIEVRSFDQRGWGRSVHKPSDRGLTGPSTTVLSDICSFLSTLPTNPSPSTPLFLGGASMGGGLALYYTLLILSERRATSDSPTVPKLLPESFTPPPFVGLILEAPYIAIPPSTTPNAFTIVAGRLLARVLPSFQLKQQLDASFLSRKPEVCKSWEEDPLCHHMATVQGGAGMLDRHMELRALSEGKPQKTRFANLYSSQTSGQLKEELSVIAFHGTGDKITSPEATKAMFDAGSNADKDPLPFLPNKTFNSIPGGYHKVHADAEGVEEWYREEVAKFIVEKSRGRGEQGQGQQDQQQQQQQQPPEAADSKASPAEAKAATAPEQAPPASASSGTSAKL